MANRTKTAAIAANRRKVREGKLVQPNQDSSTVDEIRDPNAPADATPDPKAPRDLADPATQFRILQGGDALGYTLALDAGDRDIEVRLTFTIKDELQRRVMENLDELRSLVVRVMGTYNPDYVPGTVDPQWARTHPEYIDAAMRSPAVRQRAREIVSRLSRFVDVDPDRDPELPPERVTPAMLEEGLDHDLLGATVFALWRKVDEVVAARKKARAAARPPA